MVAAIMVVVGAMAFLAGLGSSSTLPRVSSSTTISSTCTIYDEGWVIIQVLNSTNGRPIGSESVKAQFLAAECPPNPHTTFTLGPEMTNSTGYVTFGGEVGQYYIGTGSSYPVVVSTFPGTFTCVTFSVPSGETLITYTRQSAC
jgi:hypothetical protein